MMMPLHLVRRAHCPSSVIRLFVTANSRERHVHTRLEPCRVCDVGDWWGLQQHPSQFYLVGDAKMTP
jgi:hypothetical protein